MKISIKKLISYILLLCLLIAMFIFNRRRVVLVFIIAMVLYLVSAFLLFFPDFSVPTITLSMERLSQGVGENNKLICRIKYQDYFPFTRLGITYSVKHTLETHEYFVDTVYSVFHGVKEYNLDFSFKYCGIYKISCNQVRIYDLLGIFSRKIIDVEPATAIIMPSDCGLRFQTSRLVLDDEEDIYSDPFAGEDVSEIKELRDYRDGDRLSQVHWKLSTKSEDLIVKEYAKNAGVCIVIACDGSYNTPQDITAYYELLYSFGKNLISDETYFEMVYYSSFDEDVIRQKIDNVYDLTIGIQNMYFHLMPRSMEELESVYSINGTGMKLIHLTMCDVPDDKYRTLILRNNVRVVVEV